MLCISVAYAVIFTMGSHSATPFYIFRAKWHSNIPIGTPLMGASNASGIVILSLYMA